MGQRVGQKRLAYEVTKIIHGKEKADEIRMEKILNPDNVGAYVAHVKEDGTVTYDKLDADANVVEKDVKINE